jgi:hypothetical protein
MNDTELLDWLEKHHAYIFPNGYRGCWGFEIAVADPSGHYQEERTKALGYGMTIREAIQDAIKNHPTP